MDADFGSGCICGSTSSNNLKYGVTLKLYKVTWNYNEKKLEAWDSGYKNAIWPNIPAWACTWNHSERHTSWYLIMELFMMAGD